MSMGHFHVGHVWIRYLGVVNFGLGWYLLLLRVPWLPKGETETFVTIWKSTSSNLKGPST